MLATFFVMLSPIAGAVAQAQQSWNPFSEAPLPGAAPRRPARPSGEAPRAPAMMDGGPSGFGQANPRWGDPGRLPDGPAVPLAPREAVERTDLAPLPAIDGGAGSTAEPGARPDAADAMARLAADLEVPLRSAALARLLVRQVGASAGPATASVAALSARTSVLYRAGRGAEAEALLAASGAVRLESPVAGATLSTIRTRVALAVGNSQAACAGAGEVVRQGGAELPAPIVGHALVVQGYCGAIGGNLGAAGLAASLARERGGVPPATLGLLDALGAAESPALGEAQRISVLEWRLAEAARSPGLVLPGLERFEASALVALAFSDSVPPRQRIAAVEAAASINAVDPVSLAEIYRQQSFPVAELDQALSARSEPALRRARLFKAAEAERTPMKKARLIRAALDEARRAGIYVPVAAAFERFVDEIKPVAEVGWFAESAVEVLLAAGRLNEARRWAQLGMEPSVTGDRTLASLGHWLALIDIADATQRGGRGNALNAVEELALRGRFTPEALHRTATVLDALDFHVPVRLWEAASRAPQPATGHLPATGVLSELQEAAKRKDLARTVAGVIRAIGRDGAEGAHMMALGDSIRALRRVGLEADARQLAMEALFALWPRSSTS